MRTFEEIQQAVVFSALFEYHEQKFMRVGNRLRPLRDDKRIAKYWKRVLGPSWKGPPPHNWCSAFSLWCLQEAGLAPGVILLVNGINGKGWGFCEPLKLLKLPHVAIPEPGDIAYFEKFQHHAVVELADARKGVFWSIDGNQPAIDRHGPQGTLPARDLDAAKAFYSIKPLILAAQKKEAP